MSNPTAEDVPSNQTLAEACVSEVRASTPHLAGRFANQTIMWGTARAGRRPDGHWVVAVDRVDATPGLTTSSGSYLAILDWGANDRLIAGGEVDAVSSEVFASWVAGADVFAGGGDAT